MVLCTLIKLSGSPKVRPHNRWQRMQVFRFSWNFYDRQRNCYKQALRTVRRQFRYERREVVVEQLAMRQLRQERIDAAAREHGIEGHQLTEYLTRLGVALNTQTLSNLAIYEPLTFQALALMAKATKSNNKYKVTLPTGGSVLTPSHFKPIAEN
ncbi:hypothetical protein GJ496_001831 [Pomphorhynchus laevis]|nr:hypothetical protein GJ496_001831 [Pomphorhynchus laevis]